MNTGDVLTFLHEIERLKSELRHSWLASGRQESVAEHSWRMCLMVILLSDKLDAAIDRDRALRIAVIHDISEAYVGDVASFLAERADKKTQEIQAIESLKDRYTDPAIQEIYDLWQEYENQTSPEARFVKALDKLEVRIQHNEADISTWSDIEFPRALFTADRYCEYDGFLRELCDAVKDESRVKIEQESDRDIDEVQKEARTMQ